MGRRKQSLSEVLHRQNKFGLRRKTGAAKRPKFISSLDFLSPFCVKTKERYKPIKPLGIAQKRFEHPSIASPAPDLGNQRNLKTERQPDKTRSRLALCVADRFVLAFCFFFVKEKESMKNLLNEI